MDWQIANEKYFATKDDSCYISGSVRTPIDILQHVQDQWESSHYMLVWNEPGTLQSDWQILFNGVNLYRYTGTKT